MKQRITMGFPCRLFFKSAFLAVGMLLVSASAWATASLLNYTSSWSTSGTFDDDASDAVISWSSNGTNTSFSVTGVGTENALQLSSTPTNNIDGTNYLEFSTSEGTISSITIYVSGNGTNKTIQPAILGWESGETPDNTNYAYVDATPSVTCALKAYDASYALTYDLSGLDLTEVRFYRQIKNLAGAAGAGTFGSGQTFYFYGADVEIASSSCTTRTLSFSPASLSPTVGVATALPTASASAGTGDITYKMDGSTLAGQVSSYTFNNETPHTYSATIAANGGYCSASANMTITASEAVKTPQSITATASAPTAVANGLTTITLGNEGTSGTGAVTYSITKPDASVVNASSFVVDQVGAYTITATIAADATYAAATSAPITVTGTACTTNTVTLTLTSTSLDLDASETSTLTAASATSGGAVTIGGSAGLTAVGQTFVPGTTGSFTVTGTVAASGSYCPGTASQTIAVTSASEPVCATYTATRNSGSGSAATGTYSATTFCTFSGFGSSVNTATDGKLGGSGKYMGLTGTTFAAGDQIVVNLITASAQTSGNMLIFAGTSATAGNLIHEWTVAGGDYASGGSDVTVSYTLTAADATKINAAGGVYMARSDDYNQNPFMNSMQVKRCKVCTSPEPSIVVNSATASFNAGCERNLPASNLTITNASTVDYVSSDPSVAEVSADGVVTGVAAGTATITATAKNVCDQCVTKTVTVTVSAGSSYTVPATATVPNFTTPTTVTLVGTSLTNPVTVTVPVGLTVTYGGTPHAGGSNFNISAAEANAGAELSISGTTLGDYNLGFSTTTACGTLNKTTEVTVRNVAALPCPVLGEATGLTYGGGTLNWTKLADETYVSNYRIQVLKNNAVQFTLYANKGESSVLVAGLEEGTTYTFKVFALSSDENTRVSSVGCTAGSFTTPAHPETASEPCLSEDFESLGIAGGSNPSPDVTGLTEIRTGSSVSGPNGFIMPSGEWTLTNYRGLNPSYNSSNMGIRLETGGGTITMPEVDNPVEMTFYVKFNNAFNNKSYMSDSQGLQVVIGGSAITTGFQLDDGELPLVTRATASAYTSNGQCINCIDEDGYIKFADTDWHKITVDITTASLVAPVIRQVGSRTWMGIDNIEIKCAAMEMTVTPAVTGLNYVPGLGPSDAKPFVLTGTGMPLTAGSGTVTMTASNGSYFEVSTDGSTFTQTASYNIPYTTADFTKTFYIRLKNGLAEGTYSDLFTFTAPGYTKQSPTMTAKGSVTNVMSTIACGVTDRIAYLSAQDGSYTDRILSESWVASDADAGVTGFVLAVNSTLTSPSIYDAANVQLEKLTFYYQPSSGGNNTFSYRIYDGTTLKKYGTFENCTTKTAYPISIDIADVSISDNLKVVIAQGAKRTAEVWDVMITASGKKDISFSESTMELHSSQGCTSDPHMFKVYGTCLDDDSKIVVYADAVGKYQFSLDGSAWQDDTIKYAYVGEYTTRGTTFYVRLADDAPGGSSVDEIHASNDGKGLFTAYIVADVTSSSSVSPADGSTINVTSTKLGEQIMVIPIVAGELCNDLVVTSSCAGVTISDCYNGTYGNSVTYSAIDSTRAIYLKFTPGSVSSCNFTMTSGSSIDVSFTVNFDANAVLSPGHFDVNMAGAKDLTSSKFEFSLSDPAFEDFHAKTDFEAGDLVNTTLFVRTKGGVTAGDSETFTFGAKSVTITAQ